MVSKNIFIRTEYLTQFNRWKYFYFLSLYYHFASFTTFSQDQLVHFLSFSAVNISLVSETGVLPGPLTKVFLLSNRFGIALKFHHSFLSFFSYEYKYRKKTFSPPTSAFSHSLNPFTLQWMRSTSSEKRIFSFFLSFLTEDVKNSHDILVTFVSRFFSNGIRCKCSKEKHRGCISTMKNK